MRQVLRLTTIAIAGLMLAAPLATAASRTVLSGRSQIWIDEGRFEISMDGGRVAVADRVSDGDCQARVRIRVVRLADATRQTLPQTACAFLYRGLWREADGPALALGSRSVLVTTADSGNFLYPSLLAGSPADPLRTVLNKEGHGVDDTGPFIGPVVAAGGTRLYATYSQTWQPEGCDPYVPPGPCTLSPATGSIRRFPGDETVYAGSDAILPDQMEAGRIALRGFDGAARVVTLTGEVLADVPDAQADAVAVAGEDLVVLRRNARRVDVRDAIGGALQHSYTVPGSLRLLRRIDAALLGGEAWAVLASQRQVFALRLTDGHLKRLAQYRRATVSDVQIEHTGVVWSFVRPAPNPLWAVVFSPLPSSGVR